MLLYATSGSLALDAALPVPPTSLIRKSLVSTPPPVADSSWPKISYSSSTNPPLVSSPSHTTRYSL